jgi:hypothetical protein
MGARAPRFQTSGSQFNYLNQPAGKVDPSMWQHVKINQLASCEPRLVYHALGNYSSHQPVNWLKLYNVGSKNNKYLFSRSWHCLNLINFIYKIQSNDKSISYQKKININISATKYSFVLYLFNIYFLDSIFYTFDYWLNFFKYTLEHRKHLRRMFVWL